MYKLVAIAGSFDRLHKGHCFFISEAFKLGKRVIIGLTSDQFAKSKVKSQKSKVQLKSQNYQERKRQLEAFLKEEGFLGRSTIIEIDDVYGPAVYPACGGARKNEIEALVVTSDTLEGGRKVNKKRRQLGLKPLKLLQVPLIIAQDQKKIASTRIRLGEIDRSGRVLARLKLWKKPISDRLRSNLKKPLGTLLKSKPENPEVLLNNLCSYISRIKPAMFITVGDEVTKLSHENGLRPHLSIFDFRVGRKKKYSSLSDLGFQYSYGHPELVYTGISSEISCVSGSSGMPKQVRHDIRIVRNPAGGVTRSLMTAVKKAFRSYITYGNNQLIRVIGEEDLAGIPAILLAPLGSIIIYGQPGEGLVVVEVTENKKNNLMEILKI